MSNLVYRSSVLAIIIFMSACKNISKYPIDNDPLIKIDTNLLGIWKVAEDTDKANFVLIQNSEDIFRNFKIQYNKLSDDKKVKSEYDNQYNNFKKNKNYYYYITYMNRHGVNPLYQQFYAFLSEVKKTKFLNVLYWDKNVKEGYFFVRLLKTNATFDTIATAMISDTTLKHLANSKEVRNRVKKNIYRNSFYNDTLHFYKVSGYHESVVGSINKAK